MPIQSWMLTLAFVCLWLGGYFIGYARGRHDAFKNWRAPVLRADDDPEAVRGFANPGRRP